MVRTPRLITVSTHTKCNSSSKLGHPQTAQPQETGRLRIHVPRTWSTCPSFQRLVAHVAKGNEITSSNNQVLSPWVLRLINAWVSFAWPRMVTTLLPRMQFLIVEISKQRWFQRLMSHVWVFHLTWCPWWCFPLHGQVFQAYECMRWGCVFIEAIPTMGSDQPV